jgi:hypothetical protein
MHVIRRSEVMIPADQVKQPCADRNPDAALPLAPVNEPRQAANAVRHYALDRRNFETFCGGAGI